MAGLLHFGFRFAQSVKRLIQGDLLIGALEPRERLAGRHPGADVREDALDDAGRARQHRRVVLHVELRRQRQRPVDADALGRGDGARGRGGQRSGGGPHLAAPVAAAGGHQERERKG